MLTTTTNIILQISANYIFTQVFNGLVLGMILVLIALGLTLIFGLMGIVNFAHGDLLLVGAYLAWTVTDMTGRFFLGVLIAGVGVTIIGMIIERFTLRYTYRRHGPLLQLLLTFGIAEILRGTVQYIWGRTGKNYPIPDWGTGQLDFIFFNYPKYRLFVIISAGLIVVGTYIFLTRTDTGLIIRAGTQDREMVNALGLNVDRMFTLLFGIGAGIAGISGSLIGPLRGAYPALGIDLLIPAFVVVVVGGMGSFRGTIVAGLIVGEVIAVTAIFASAASDIMIYVLMAIVLIGTSRGIFGEGEEVGA